MRPLVARKADLRPLLGISEAVAFRLEKRGEFPKRRQLADGSVGWLVRELEAWAESRPLAEGRMRGEETRLRRKRERAKAESV